MTVDQVEAAGGYSIILADPPWSYRDTGCLGSAEGQYRTMGDDAIASLPISRLAAKDAVLFLWGTYPKLPDVLDLIPRWGFTFKTLAFQWVKTRGAHPDGSSKPFLGLGHWTRGNTEPCLLAVRGNLRRIDASIRQLVISELGKHSAKPPEVRDRIVELMGDLPRIELFARERVPGWDAWGAEIESDIAMGVTSERAA